MTREEAIQLIELESGESVTPETPIELLGLDSLELINLFVTLEIPDETIPAMNRIQDILGYVEAHA